MVTAMSATSTIRQALGISQQQLAHYLGVSRSHIALAETSRRLLSTAALLKLHELEQALTNSSTTASTTALLAQQQEAANAALAARLKELTYQREQLTLTLQQLQGQQQQCIHTLQVCQQLQAQGKQGEANTKE